jgi:anti-anti-sigma factor
MKMNESGDSAVLTFPEGKLTDIGRRDFSDTLLALIRAGKHRRIVVDLGATRWLSSVDLGVFAFAARECREREVSLSLARVRPAVRGVFEKTGLEQFFPMFDTVEAAREPR